jgi:tryptophan synthase beta chain
MAPTISLMANEGEINVKAHNQLDTFEAATLFARTEGIVPAPEPSHAIKETIEEALRCKKTGEEKSILFLLCGHGHFDMKAYDDYNAGKLQPYDMPKEKIEASLGRLRELYPKLNN